MGRKGAPFGFTLDPTGRVRLLSCARVGCDGPVPIPGPSQTQPDSAPREAPRVISCKQQDEEWQLQAQRCRRWQGAGGGGVKA